MACGGLLSLLQLVASLFPFVVSLYLLVWLLLLVLVAIIAALLPPASSAGPASWSFSVLVLVFCPVLLLLLASLLLSPAPLLLFALVLLFVLPLPQVSSGFLRRGSFVHSCLPFIFGLLTLMLTASVA